MAEVSYPFDGQVNNEAEWWPMARLWTSDGVVHEDYQPVTLGSGLSFVVPDGFAAWVRGAYYVNEGQLIKTATDNLNSNPRYDQLVLRLDRAANSITAEILEGTPAASPTLPLPTADDATVWEIPIAYAFVPGSASAQNYSGLTANNPWSGAIQHFGDSRTEKWGDNAAGNVASATFTATRSGRPDVQGTFIAPPSGLVEVRFRSKMRSASDASAVLLTGFRYGLGAVIDSNVIAEADDNLTIQHSGTTDQSAGNWDVLDLAPGGAYWIQLVYRRSGTADLIVTYPALSVTPLLA